MDFKTIYFLADINIIDQQYFSALIQILILNQIIYVPFTYNVCLLSMVASVRLTGDKRLWVGNSFMMNQNVTMVKKIVSYLRSFSALSRRPYQKHLDSFLWHTVPFMRSFTWKLHDSLPKRAWIRAILFFLISSF